jgi:DNA-binding NarL/FixJ family response regulator
MSLKILLVDDNLTFLASVKKSLKMLPNVQVMAEAHNGVQALEMAQRLQPDLVLLDIVMPQMSGLEVAAYMQGWERSPYIVFLSLHDNESYRSAAHDLGVLGMVGKANFVADLMPIITTLAAELAASAGN